MFQILEFTETTLASVTNRVEKHGDDDKQAVSCGFEITTSNDILDLIDKDLAPRLYKHPDSKPLPGVRDALTVLACNSIDRVLLPTKHDGWTLEVDDGIDDTTPMVFGDVKVDKFSVEPKQGGSVVLRLRVGTSDLDAARAGMLAMHVGRPLWIKLIAPKAGEEKKAAPKAKDPDATDMFVGADKAKKVELSKAAWPFPKRENNSLEAPPQRVTTEVVKPKPATKTKQ